MTSSGSQNSLTIFSPPPGRDGPPIPIPGSSVRIGQGPQNDVVLDDDTVSTNHARLEFADGAWRLTDLDSRNGTFVNGERLANGGTTLLDLDTPVAFGAVKLVFAAGSGDDRPPPEVISRAAAVGAPATTLADRPGFRLPVWMLLLIILVIAVAITVVLWLGGGPVEAPAAMAGEDALLLALQIAGSAS